MAYQGTSEAPCGNVVYGGPGFLGAFGEVKTPVCPPLKFVCNPDCPFPSSSCKKRKDLCDRVLGAINLANRAAALLETKPRSSVTVTVFRQVFGQAPSDPWEVPGHPGRTIAAGDLAARRFRAVANELQTSDTMYRCVDTNRCQTIKSGGGCSNGGDVRTLSGLGNFQIVERPGGEVLRPEPVPVTPSPSCHPTETIVVDNVAMALLCKNEVWLCPPFWQLKNLWQEGTILHEMFHLCFGLTCSWFQHDQKERKRNSAYCYEVFACGGAAAAEPVSVATCKAKAQ
jgi:hypothetical protein